MGKSEGLRRPLQVLAFSSQAEEELQGSYGQPWTPKTKAR